MERVLAWVPLSLASQLYICICLLTVSSYLSFAFAAVIWFLEKKKKEFLFRNSILNYRVSINKIILKDENNWKSNLAVEVISTTFKKSLCYNSQPR